MQNKSPQEWSLTSITFLYLIISRQALNLNKFMRSVNFKLSRILNAVRYILFFATQFLGLQVHTVNNKGNQPLLSLTPICLDT